ncbi:MAG: Gfo/Idh/MocA family oxidoreductase [Alphaproteobacteria bacterium]|nr:Gfo/Idh/MocA family oxidoreductase [Alphaproteobacteria bacterium]MBU2148755.1 Gfo/Idh/MocA family oxidoreductase [Alphaproteobacteria bacterium]
MRKTRIAIIGLGMAVAPHARSLQDLAERAEVVVAFSPTQVRRDAFAQAWGFPVTGDLDGIFSDISIDAVMILTPPNSHLDLVRRAAGAGKHILLEKPLETSIAKAEELVATAEAAGVKLGVVLQNRFKPASVKLARLLAEGSLGAIVSASARTRNWRPQSYYDQPGRGTLARDGGGVLLTQAIHTLDLFISLAGLPQEVTCYATTSPIHSMETEDLAMAATRYANGAIGTISATTCAYPGFPDAIDIIGTLGTAQLDDLGLTVQLHDGTSLSETAVDAAAGAGADPMAFSHQHHRAVLADFLDAVEGDGQPKITGREALKVHRLIEAMLRSSQSGSRQSL